MMNRRAFSDVIQDANTSRRKEDARRAEFVRIGQVSLSLLAVLVSMYYTLHSKGNCNT